MCMDLFKLHRWSLLLSGVSHSLPSLRAQEDQGREQAWFYLPDQVLGIVTLAVTSFSLNSWVHGELSTQKSGMVISCALALYMELTEQFQFSINGKSIALKCDVFCHTPAQRPPPDQSIISDLSLDFLPLHKLIPSCSLSSITHFCLELVLHCPKIILLVLILEAFPGISSSDPLQTLWPLPCFYDPPNSEVQLQKKKSVF